MTERRLVGPELQQLINLLAKLPGLGPRSARRAALGLLVKRESLMAPLAQAMTTAAEKVRPCVICGNFDTEEICAICQDASRDKSVVCVVEDVADIWALERAGAYQGLYHVLGGTLSAIGGVGPDDLSIAPLIDRVQKGVREVILALDVTVDGQATAHYLSERLEPTGVTITRLAHGVPVGGELDYLDEGTLTAALQARRPL